MTNQHTPDTAHTHCQNYVSLVISKLAQNAKRFDSMRQCDGRHANRCERDKDSQENNRTTVRSTVR